MSEEQPIVTAVMVREAENAWPGDCDSASAWPEFIAAHLTAALASQGATLAKAAGE